MHGWWAASYAVLWLLVFALCVVVVALARQIGTLHLRLGPRGALDLEDEGPVVGRPPPAAVTVAFDGATEEVAAPGAARLLLFVSAGCSLCHDVLRGLAPVARSAGLVPTAISDLDPIETQRAFGGAAVSGPEVARAWGVPGTPYAVVLDETGAVTAKGTPNNLEQLEGLVDGALRRGAVGRAS